MSNLEYLNSIIEEEENANITIFAKPGEKLSVENVKLLTEAKQNISINICESSEETLIWIGTLIIGDEEIVIYDDIKIPTFFVESGKVQVRSIKKKAVAKTERKRATRGTKTKNADETTVSEVSIKEQSDEKLDTNDGDKKSVAADEPKTAVEEKAETDENAQSFEGAINPPEEEIPEQEIENTKKEVVSKEDAGMPEDLPFPLDEDEAAPVKSAAEFLALDKDMDCDKNEDAVRLFSILNIKDCIPKNIELSKLAMDISYAFNDTEDLSLIEKMLTTKYPAELVKKIIAGAEDNNVAFVKMSKEINTKVNYNLYAD